MRAFVALWDELTRERYGVTDPAQRRFRYGVQVNSLGLTEAQPENNVQRIVLEMLAVTLSQGRAGAGGAAAGVERGARAAPAVGPAVVAADAAGARLRVRPARVRGPVRRLGGGRGEGGRAGRGRTGRDATGCRRMGGAVAAVESGYMKSALVASHSAAAPRIESGERGRGRRQPVHQHRAEPADGRPGHRRSRRVDPDVEAGAVAARWRAGGPSATRTRPARRAARGAGAAARRRAGRDANLMPATLRVRPRRA